MFDISVGSCDRERGTELSTLILSNQVLLAEQYVKF